MSRGPYTYFRYLARARALLAQPNKLLALGNRASAKLGSGSVSDRLAQVREQLHLMLALVKASVSGEYQGLSRGSLLSIAAALLYFVAPVDAIPDFLLGLGYIDDVAVIGFVVKQVQQELDTFRQWQVQTKNTGGSDGADE